MRCITSARPAPIPPASANSVGKRYRSKATIACLFIVTRMAGLPNIHHSVTNDMPIKKRNKKADDAAHGPLYHSAAARAALRLDDDGLVLVADAGADGADA